MDTKYKVRTVTRRQFTKPANMLDLLLSLCKTDKSKLDELQACHKVTKGIYNQLTIYDYEIRESIISMEPFDEIEIEKELNDAGNYEARWNLLDTRYAQFNNLNGDNINSISKVKLPILELKKFDGNIKNWLSFWGQFRKIDDDPAIEDCDKLQFLCQNMQPDSDVKRFVENFPITSQSYKICLEELKARYAREDVLIQLYVQELLEIILKKDKLDLTTLHDNISSHLRSLEVLKVTSEKYSPFLLPIVQSALPNDILKIWERQKPDKVSDELAHLLEFLKKEVEANQRISLSNDFHLSSASSHPTAAF